MLKGKYKNHKTQTLSVCPLPVILFLCSGKQYSKASEMMLNDARAKSQTQEKKLQ